MFAAYLTYQLIDLALALLVVAWVDRRVGGRASLRRTLARSVPLSALLLLLIALVCGAWLHHLVGWLAWNLFERPWSIRFLGVGAAYWGGTLVLPALVVARAWRAGHGARAGSLLALAATLLLAFEMSWREPRRIVVERREVVLADWPLGAPPLTVAVLADLQSPLLGTRERDLVAQVAAAAPDLIVLPGDLVAQSFADAQSIACARFVLDGTQAPLGTFAVNGDIDPLVEGGLAEVVRGTRARALANESVMVALPGGGAFELAGFDAEQPERFAALLAAPPRAPLRVALVHKPEHVAALGPAGFDLVIAGHTHGGQIVVPGIGPLVTLSKLPDAIDAGGLHEFAGTELYVSRGLGCEAGFAPPLRLCCPPELTLLTLRGRTALERSAADGAPPAAPAASDARHD